MIRLPRALGKGSKLWRCSLFTTDHRKARRAILPYLVWLVNMKDAKTVEQLIDTVLTQIDTYMHEGAAPDARNMHLRLAVLDRLQDYLKEWTKADLCPIEYAMYYRRLPELREAKIHLSALITADSERFPYVFDEESDDKSYYRSRLLYGHGREDFYEDVLAEAEANGEDVEDMADACAANEFNGCETEDIAAHYFEKVRPRAKAQPGSSTSPAPASVNSAAQQTGTYPALPPTMPHSPGAAMNAAPPDTSLRLSEAKKLFLDDKAADYGDRRADEDAGTSSSTFL